MDFGQLGTVRQIEIEPATPSFRILQHCTAAFMNVPERLKMWNLIHLVVNLPAARFLVEGDGTEFVARIPIR